MGLSASPLVAPFRGERYGPGVSLSQVVAPPYDVIDEADRRTLARHAANVVHVILPQGTGHRYTNAARLLDAWRREGLVAADPDPGVYVVRQEFRTPERVGRARTGVIAAVAAEPFARGRVKPHERTHAGPKQDRLELLRSTRTMCEALLMLSRDSTGALRRGLAEVTQVPPLARAELADVAIGLWRVDRDRAAGLVASAGAEPLYIADGHHRYETTVAYGDENRHAGYTLGLIVPLGDPGLVVLPTHRLLRGKPPSADVVTGLADRCTVERIGSVGQVEPTLSTLRAGRGGCVVVLEREAYGLTRLGGELPSELRGYHPSVASLDVAWAEALVLPPLKQSVGVATLGYTPDREAALQAVRRGEAGAAVLLNPPTVDQVLAVADAGAYMPPKATFFTPKVPSGLVFLNYDHGPLA